jgi:integrase
LPDLRKFRKGLPFAPLTQVKAVEMTRAFFQFCVDSEWIEKNPAKKLKAPRVKDIPTLPFEEDEVKGALIDACAKWPEVSHQAGVNWKEMRALFLVLRWTGLRISDGVTLSKKKVEGARVFLRAPKTGEAVYVPVPPIVIEALAEIETDNQHCFWSGVGNVKTVIETWRRRMLKVAKIANVTSAEFHRFRDTFSVALLKRNVSVENVAILLGISPATVLKHYAPWVKSRQDALTTAVSQTWESVDPSAR